MWLRGTSTSNLRSLNRLILGSEELCGEISCMWRSSEAVEEDAGVIGAEFSYEQEKNLVPLFGTCYGHFDLPLWPLDRDGASFSVMLDAQCSVEGGFSIA